MNWSEEGLRKLIEERRGELYEFLKKSGFFADNEVVGMDGTIIHLVGYDDEKQDFDIMNPENWFGHFDYEQIAEIGNKVFEFKPRPKPHKDDIPELMVEFAKDVMRLMDYNIDDAMARLTDTEDGYYIVCFHHPKDAAEREYYAEKSDIEFKVATKDNIIFQLSEWPKANLNLTGRRFWDEDVNSYPLLAGIFISHIYFGNAEKED